VEWYWQGKTEKLESKTRPSATLPTANPTWIDLGANPWTEGTNIYRSFGENVASGNLEVWLWNYRMILKWIWYLITMNTTAGYWGHRVSLCSTSSRYPVTTDYGLAGSLRTQRGALITAGRQMTAARVTRAINNSSNQLMWKCAAWTTLHQLLTYDVLRISEVSCSDLGREALYYLEGFPWCR
jgi:hypothetical protein